jgi:hypothetical protein
MSWRCTINRLRVEKKGGMCDVIGSACLIASTKIDGFAGASCLAGRATFSNLLHKNVFIPVVRDKKMYSVQWTWTWETARWTVFGSTWIFITPVYYSVTNIPREIYVCDIQTPNMFVWEGNKLFRPFTTIVRYECNFFFQPVPSTCSTYGEFRL